MRKPLVGAIPGTGGRFPGFIAYDQAEEKIPGGKLVKSMGCCLLKLTNNWSYRGSDDSFADL
jgi:hypothetical protein